MTASTKENDHGPYPHAFAEPVPKPHPDPWNGPTQAHRRMICKLALALALAFGCVVVWKGNRRSSIQLLASAVLAISLGVLAVPFNFYFWLMIDLAVIIAIWHEDMSYRDMAIVVLFVPGWVNYALTGSEPYFWISWGIVMAQFCLTLPLERAKQRMSRWVAKLKGDHFDLLVAA